MAADIGVIGMAVMGQNLARNIESRGYTVGVYNRTAEKTRELMEGAGKGKRLPRVVPGRPGCRAGRASRAAHHGASGEAGG